LSIFCFFVYPTADLPDLHSFPTRRSSDLASLVPNLVETVKGYASHERETFEEVTRARSAVEQAGSIPDAAAANNMLTGALRHLFAVAENYPQLRASENFMNLQTELSDIEEKIAFSRQFYNTNVLDYNNRLQTVPTVF